LPPLRVATVAASFRKRRNFFSDHSLGFRLRPLRRLSLYAWTVATSLIAIAPPSTCAPPERIVQTRRSVVQEDQTSNSHAGVAPDYAGTGGDKAARGLGAGVSGHVRKILTAICCKRRSA